MLDNVLYFANVGDSRAMLAEPGGKFIATTDHQAEGNKAEQDRVAAAGIFQNVDGKMKILSKKIKNGDHR